MGMGSPIGLPTIPKNKKIMILNDKPMAVSMPDAAALDFLNGRRAGS